MSLESSVANVLRDKPVGRINFKVEGIAINKERMESVAKAIETQDISVDIESTGPQLALRIRRSYRGGGPPAKRS